MAKNVKHPSAEQIAEFVEYLNELAAFHRGESSRYDHLPAIGAHFLKRANLCEGWAMALPQLLTPKAS